MEAVCAFQEGNVHPLWFEHAVLLHFIAAERFLKCLAQFPLVDELEFAGVCLSGVRGSSPLIFVMTSPTIMEQ